MSMYNVEFVGDHLWIGTTVQADNEDTAIDFARDQIHQESGMQWHTLSTVPHVTVELLEAAS